MRFATRWILRLAGVLVGLTLIAVFVAWRMLAASLPQIAGEIPTADISASIIIERDAAGIPTIRAGNRRDLAYATGLVHGQDRFFQMDLLRRSAAGELAALLGPVASGYDRRLRLHRFRARAERWLRSLDEYEAGLLQAYSRGVNAALASLSARPFEYIVLRSQPASWQPEDSLLVVAAMFIDLNDERADRDVERGFAARVLPRAVFDWLYPEGSRWDAPLMGAARSEASFPAPEVYDLRGERPRDGSKMASLPVELPGSNNWAVSGHLTDSGHAIVANDMHLGLRVPNTFYRARLQVAALPAIDLSGVTLPGTPVMVAGSNGRVAWGFTNSYGDWSDAIIVREGSDADHYLAPGGEQRFEIHEEVIEVRGGAPETLRVRETIWGPVREDVVHPEGELAIAWIAQEEAAVDLAQLELETAADVQEALAIANRMRLPPQNFVVGDAAGNIGWTIAGRIPLRSDYDAELPADGSEQQGFAGWLPAAEYPRIVNPPNGRLWTANARVVDGEAYDRIGDGGYALGARAQQIRDGLDARERFSPADMLQLQLDDRAVFLQHWRDLLLALLDDAAVKARPQRGELRDLVDDWVPRASTDAVGYRLVRAFRDELQRRVFEMLVTPVRNAYPHDVNLRISRQFEAPLWSLVNARPVHLLTDNVPSWRALMLAAADTVQDDLKGLPGTLAARRWGERNTAAIRHPLSPALPWLSRWLDMPRDELPGGRDMPRVQGPAFGASERFAVAPGDEQHAYLHMPTGASGHPLSPFYGNGHGNWVEGRPSPFLPGEAAHRLVLVPLQ